MDKIYAVYLYDWKVEYQRKVIAVLARDMQEALSKAKQAYPNTAPDKSDVVEIAFEPENPVIVLWDQSW